METPSIIVSCRAARQPPLPAVPRPPPPSALAPSLRPSLRYGPAPRPLPIGGPDGGQDAIEGRRVGAVQGVHGEPRGVQVAHPLEGVDRLHRPPHARPDDVADPLAQGRRPLLRRRLQGLRVVEGPLHPVHPVQLDVAALAAQGGHPSFPAQELPQHVLRGQPLQRRLDLRGGGPFQRDLRARVRARCPCPLPCPSPCPPSRGAGSVYETSPPARAPCRCPAGASLERNVDSPMCRLGGAV